jgi:hypothetical protein
MGLNEQELYDLIFQAVTDSQYEKENPEIKDRYVYSASTLAYSAQKQLDFKLNGNPSLKIEANMRMMKGKAIHEFIQSRKCFESPDWISEFKLENDYQYDSVIQFTIIGHIDIYNYSEKSVIELKTTSHNTPYLTKYYVNQAGYYAYCLYSDAYVVVFSEKSFQVYKLTPQEIFDGYERVVNNAKWVTKRLMELDRLF